MPLFGKKDQRKGRRARQKQSQRAAKRNRKARERAADANREQAAADGTLFTVAAGRVSHGVGCGYTGWAKCPKTGRIRMYNDGVPGRFQDEMREEARKAEAGY
jgi:hypothetical protein